MSGALLQILDGIKVRRRRVELGLSAAALAGGLGTTQQVIYRLEHGMRQNDLDVAFIVDLAAALGVNPGQLMLDEAVTRHTPDQPDSDRTEAEDSDRVETTDCQRAAAVLAEAGNWIYVDDLAASLGWTSERALIALETLGSLLPVVGQRLAWLNDREVRLCGDIRAGAALRSVTAHDIATAGLNFTEARTLFLMVNGAKPPRHRASLMAMSRLTRLGHIEADPAPHGRNDDLPRLTTQARFDLYLDELDLDGSRKLRRRHRNQAAGAEPDAGPTDEH